MTHKVNKNSKIHNIYRAKPHALFFLNIFHNIRRGQWRYVPVKFLQTHFYTAAAPHLLCAYVNKRLNLVLTIPFSKNQATSRNLLQQLVNQTHYVHEQYLKVTITFTMLCPLIAKEVNFACKVLCCEGHNNKKGQLYSR